MTDAIPTANRATWLVGQRVSRTDKEELGNVIEINGSIINGSIKVRWDDGRTSYFRHGERGNVQLEQLAE